MDQAIQQASKPSQNGEGKKAALDARSWYGWAEGNLFALKPSLDDKHIFCCDTGYLDAKLVGLLFSPPNVAEGPKAISQPMKSASS